MENKTNDMEYQKCELCGRTTEFYVEEIKPIDFYGNTFNACEGCRDYLESEYQKNLQIREMPEKVLPQFKDLAGIDLTGGVDPTEYIRKLRGSENKYKPVADRLAELEAENNLYKTALNFAAAGTLELIDDIVWGSSSVSEQFKSEFLDLIEKLEAANKFLCR